LSFSVAQGRRPQHQLFDVPSISTYVPQITSNVFAYPLFACNICNIPEELFDWNNLDHPHSYYNLTRDAGRVVAQNGYFAKDCLFDSHALANRAKEEHKNKWQQ
jgi:hypothetical protein